MGEMLTSRPAPAPPPVPAAPQQVTARPVVIPRGDPQSGRRDDPRIGTRAQTYLDGFNGVGSFS